MCSAEALLSEHTSLPTCSPRRIGNMSPEVLLKSGIIHVHGTAHTNHWNYYNMLVISCILIACSWMKEITSFLFQKKSQHSNLIESHFIGNLQGISRHLSLDWRAHSSRRMVHWVWMCRTMAPPLCLAWWWHFLSVTSLLGLRSHSL